MREIQERVRVCRHCALSEGRTNPVFGAGSAAARLMFAGEAPGYHEDLQGVPFVGQAGKLLDKLLARIGLSRRDVYIANVLKCRPPGNRDPQTEEIEMCRAFLEEQISIIEPVVICSLGNFATKLLSGKPDGISRVRGRTQPLAGREALLFPVYHPAAALYTPGNLKVLESDFDLLAGLLGQPRTQPEVETGNAAPSPAAKEPEPPGETYGEAGGNQLGLF